MIHRKKRPAGEVVRELVTGSWRRLIFAAPGIEPGLADKAAYSFCALEHLHRALRRRDVYARSGDQRGDPRWAKLLAGDRWESAQPTVLTALGLEAEFAAHLAELAELAGVPARCTSAWLHSRTRRPAGRVRPEVRRRRHPRCASRTSPLSTLARPPEQGQ
ncbi:hypothetical protein [Streptomyces nojiriensis]|uniref:hypothetical protein n=1 Tax=Streptomyces nojiriensis TaxID=66374 RepID=UPI00367BE304